MLNMGMFLMCGKLCWLECTNPEGKLHADSKWGQEQITLHSERGTAGKEFCTMNHVWL